MLKPDGKLLLVTCSLWPQESEQQAAAFAKRNHAVRLPAPGQLLPVVSDETDHDGLFYALFQNLVHEFDAIGFPHPSQRHAGIRRSQAALRLAPALHAGRLPAARYQRPSG